MKHFKSDKAYKFLEIINLIIKDQMKLVDPGMLEIPNSSLQGKRIASYATNPYLQKQLVDCLGI